MTLSLTCDLPDVQRCEPGWDKFQGFCYRHYGQRLSWEVAELHCRMAGAHLVSIMSPEEQTFLSSRCNIDADDESNDTVVDVMIVVG